MDTRHFVALCNPKKYDIVGHMATLPYLWYRKGNTPPGHPEPQRGDNFLMWSTMDNNERRGLIGAGDIVSDFFPVNSPNVKICQHFCLTEEFANSREKAGEMFAEVRLRLWADGLWVGDGFLSSKSATSVAKIIDARGGLGTWYEIPRDLYDQVMVERTGRR